MDTTHTTPTRSFPQFLARKAVEHGARFDASDLAPQFIPFYESGARIEVISESGDARRGRVGVTTGWRPVFLLMHRVSDHGSSDVLRATDRIVKVIAR